MGDRVLANYNIEEPKSRGFWYIVNVKGFTSNKSGRIIIADVLVSDEMPLKDCQLLFPDEIMKIEERKLLEDRTLVDEEPEARTTAG